MATKTTARSNKNAARRKGVLYEIKKAVLKNPKSTPEQIGALLEKKGMTFSHWTVETVRADFLSTLRFLEAEGYDLVRNK